MQIKALLVGRNGFTKSLLTTDPPPKIVTICVNPHNETVGGVDADSYASTLRVDFFLHEYVGGVAEYHQL